MNFHLSMDGCDASAFSVTTFMSALSRFRISDAYTLLPNDSEENAKLRVFMRSLYYSITPLYRHTSPL